MDNMNNFGSYDPNRPPYFYRSDAPVLMCNAM